MPRWRADDQLVGLLSRPAVHCPEPEAAVAGVGLPVVGLVVHDGVRECGAVEGLNSGP